MPVVVKQIKSGNHGGIWALGDGSSFSLLDFLLDLKDSDQNAFDKINSLLDYSVDHGPPRNKEKCRALSGAKDLFEFKTGDGVRIIWFWDAGRMMICSHGVFKEPPKRFKVEIKTAEKMKAGYEKAKKSKTLKTIRLK